MRQISLEREKQVKSKSLMRPTKKLDTSLSLSDSMRITGQNQMLKSTLGFRKGVLKNREDLDITVDNINRPPSVEIVNISPKFGI